MSIVILTQEGPEAAADYATILAAALPDLDVHVWPETGPRDQVLYAVVWQPPPGELGRFPNLRGIFNLGAGVDAILRDPTLPAEVPLMRLADAGMGPQMVEYCLYGVLHFHRAMDLYRRDQTAGAWTPRPFKSAADRRVGVLGLGALGSAVAQGIAGLGFKVMGWSRSPRQVEGVSTVAGRDILPRFLGRTEILVNLLPLTPETRGLINADTLAALPAGACLVNAARGAHIVEADLLAALDSGHIRGALLDAFEHEPLPADHPYRHHPAVTVTPHIAAQTIPMEACKQIVANIKRLEDGRPPLNLVDRATGY
ncbi:glyoxylate/hydroxypyruvate reductase A [Caenispirillum bisanense]|uniref:2-hydroxyacid dehydrogenase n=1 Tax=Caenispirillum bisanense TaxID=414052 RepID=UPI0031CF68B4